MATWALRCRTFVHAAARSVSSRHRVASIRSFSADSDSGGGADASGEDGGNSTSITTSFSAPFPWRHSPDPLPRLAEGIDLSGLPNTARASFVRKMLVARELGVPWLQIFVTRGWEGQLAENFSWAFRRGVAGVLSKAFRVPIDEIDDEEGGLVRIDTTTSDESKSTPVTMPDDEKEETDELVDAMLEESLRILYSEIDPSATQIKLTMRPISWRFNSAFLIPMFTRAHVKRDPSLRGKYQEIEKEFVASGSVAKVQEMGEKLAKDAGFSGERSLIAEVSVLSIESFQVLDAATGDIIQGCQNDREEEVVHLVRMEMVTTKEGQGGRGLGSWKIIDWDDLLDGNVWH